MSHVFNVTQRLAVGRVVVHQLTHNHVLIMTIRNQNDQNDQNDYTPGMQYLVVFTTMMTRWPRFYTNSS